MKATLKTKVPRKGQVWIPLREAPFAHSWDDGRVRITGVQKGVVYFQWARKGNSGWSTRLQENRKIEVFIALYKRRS